MVVFLNLHFGLSYTNFRRSVVVDVSLYFHSGVRKPLPEHILVSGRRAYVRGGASPSSTDTGFDTIQSA